MCMFINIYIYKNKYKSRIYNNLSKLSNRTVRSASDQKKQPPAAPGQRRGRVPEGITAHRPNGRNKPRDNSDGDTAGTENAAATPSSLAVSLKSKHATTISKYTSGHLQQRNTQTRANVHGSLFCNSPKLETIWTPFSGGHGRELGSACTVDCDPAFSRSHRCFCNNWDDSKKMMRSEKSPSRKATYCVQSSVCHSRRDGIGQTESRLVLPGVEVGKGAGERRGCVFGGAAGGSPGSGLVTFTVSTRRPAADTVAQDVTAGRNR